MHECVRLDITEGATAKALATNPLQGETVVWAALGSSSESQTGGAGRTGTLSCDTCSRRRRGNGFPASSLHEGGIEPAEL